MVGDDALSTAPFLKYDDGETVPIAGGKGSVHLGLPKVTIGDMLDDIVTVGLISFGAGHICFCLSLSLSIHIIAGAVRYIKWYGAAFAFLRVSTLPQREITTNCGGITE